MIETTTRPPTKTVRASTRRIGSMAFSVLVISCGAGQSTTSCTGHVAPKASPHIARTNVRDLVTGEMVSVSEGTFKMGNAYDEDDERPVHAVDLAAFEIDRTEVTVRAYDACVVAGGCTEPGADTYCNWPHRNVRPKHPINCVSWSDAASFCAWADKRLPSEAEWEYAARGPDARTYPWGAEAPQGQLCWDGQGSSIVPGSRRGTCEVASFPQGRSPFGADDMAGNVLEWTNDFYSASYVDERSTERKVNRGGSWITYEGRDLRASLRFRMTPARRDFTVGFRCVR